VSTLAEKKCISEFPAINKGLAESLAVKALSLRTDLPSKIMSATEASSIDGRHCCCVLVFTKLTAIGITSN